MGNTKDLLECAERVAPAAAFTFVDLERARARRELRGRIGTVLVALALAVSAIGSVVVALRQPGEGIVDSRGSGRTLPPPSEEPVVAAPGEFYYRAVLFVSGGCSGGGEPEVTAVGESTPVCRSTGTRLDATYWWRDDDAGRIVVDDRANYGIEAGRFGPGGFPNGNGIDVSGFPLETEALTRFLLERSAEDGASPAPLVTPPPEGAPNDGQLWRAITDLLQDPHVTPAVRAAILDVAASLQGSNVEADAMDPFGRSAHVITFGNWGGEVTEKLYVAPATHELLAWTAVPTEGDAFMVFVAQDAGVVDSTEVAAEPRERSVPLTLLSTEDVIALFHAP
jgi:hypothetical protein